MQKVKQTAIKARKRYCEPHFLFILIIVYVKAVLADDSGNVESNQDSKVQVTVEGGELLPIQERKNVLMPGNIRHTTVMHWLSSG